MKAIEWFAIASAEGAFCGRDYTPKQDRPLVGGPQVVDRWNAATRKWDQIWSDTGLPYNPKVHGGR